MAFRERELQELLREFPDLIEPGLRFVEQEFRIRDDLRIDLRFCDANDQDLWVECKRGEVTREDIGQINQYAGEIRRFNPTARVMLVAGKIGPAFGVALRTGRIEVREFGSTSHGEISLENWVDERIRAAIEPLRRELRRIAELLEIRPGEEEERQLVEEEREMPLVLADTDLGEILSVLGNDELRRTFQLCLEWCLANLPEIQIKTIARTYVRLYVGEEWHWEAWLCDLMAQRNSIRVEFPIEDTRLDGFGVDQLLDFTIVRAPSEDSWGRCWFRVIEFRNFEEGSDLLRLVAEDTIAYLEEDEDEEEED